MSQLADWLDAHQDRLAAASLEKLTGREVLRQEAQPAVRAFFEALGLAVRQGKRDGLEGLLRGWAQSNSPLPGSASAGLLAVLGTFKRVLWEVYQADPPGEAPLAAAAELDQVMDAAAAFAAECEIAVLRDRLLRAWAMNRTTTESEGLISDFVSVAAHELKTPLTVIEGYANMLKMELPEAAHPRPALLIKGVDHGIRRLRDLIEDLIDVSLVEGGLLDLDQQPVWLRRLLDIVQFEAEEAARSRRITLDLQRETLPALPILGDPERLRQVFQKLVANAIKYTPDGGTVTIAGRSRSGFAEILVEDTGIGIAPENLERIFEKFPVIGGAENHSSGKVKFKGGGPGLGLAIARGIVEAHGGMIWAESPGYDEARPAGSRFHVLLPALDVPPGAEVSPLLAAALESFAAARPPEPVSPSEAAPPDPHTPPKPAETSVPPASAGLKE